MASDIRIMRRTFAGRPTIGLAASIWTGQQREGQNQMLAQFSFIDPASCEGKPHIRNQANLASDSVFHETLAARDRGSRRAILGPT